VERLGQWRIQNPESGGANFKTPIILYYIYIWVRIRWHQV